MEILIDTTTQSQNEPGNNGNEGVIAHSLEL